MTEAVLTVDSLTKIFHTGRRGTAHIAVNDVSFTLRAGRILALVGESGSGKTTIGRIICGVDKPTSGSVQLAAQSGADPARPRTAHKRIQMVFQDPYASLNPFNTVQYTVMRPLMNYLRLSPRAAAQKAHELMETVRLIPPADFLAKRPDELSGGQRQRVVIARALAAEPEVIVADEPVSMLDVSIRSEIVTLLNDLRNTGRVRTMLYITHDLLSARMIADELAVLYKGRLVEYGPTETILGNPLHPYTRLLWSAIPNPRQSGAKTANGTTAAQAQPARAATPQGCAFADRCPLATDRCFDEIPVLEQQPDGRRTACHAVSPSAAPAPVGQTRHDGPSERGTTY